jgi:Mrp family chromosome partitioning ATPase
MASNDPLLSARAPRFAPEASPAVEARVKDPALASILNPGSAAFEPYRILKTKLQSLDATRSLRCLGLVSATGGEGTSTVALGLAAALAQRGEQRVLLVEASTQVPSLERRLGLLKLPGLGEWLETGGERPTVLRRMVPWGFHLLGGSGGGPHASALLGSETMARFIVLAKESFDFVLFDCPPLERGADSVVLQGLLDGLLLVVRARHASRDTIRQALSSIDASRVRCVAFNDRTHVLARWLDRRRPQPQR